MDIIKRYITLPEGALHLTLHVWTEEAGRGAILEVKEMHPGRKIVYTLDSKFLRWDDSSPHAGSTEPPDRDYSGAYYEVTVTYWFIPEAVWEKMAAGNPKV